MGAQNLHRRRPRQTQERRMTGIQCAGATDVGCVREGNEDSFLILPDQGLFAIADGMGGCQAGEVASALAIEEISAWFTQHRPFLSEIEGVRALRGAVVQAGDSVYAASLQSCRGKMGTTVVATLVYDRRLFIACVGDSRAYLWRRQSFVQLTRDQTMAAALVDYGLYATDEEARRTMSPGYARALSQFVGSQYPLNVALTAVDLRRGDVLLLCSDGLTGMLTDDVIMQVLSTEIDPANACAKLIELANAAGGEDNITTIVARFDGEDLSLPTPQDVADLKREPYVPAPNAG
jgi:serine/threonine protein phosphatase PrpC